MTTQTTQDSQTQDWAERRARTVEMSLVSDPNGEAAQRVLRACRNIMRSWSAQYEKEAQDEREQG